MTKFSKSCIGNHIRSIRSSFINKARTLCDSELREIKHIIKSGENDSHNLDELTMESDAVFIRRLETFPQALKMSFWENHFEWKSLECYPQICGRMLDFGCGSGHLDIMLARNGMTVKGIDLSPIGISIANNLKSKEVIQVQERLSFEVADVTKVSPREELFDSAWSAHVFEHITDPGPVLKGMKNWLKPGAYLLISVPLGFAHDDPGHVNHFENGEQLSSFLEEYITVERIDISSEYNVIRALCRV